MAALGVSLGEFFRPFAAIRGAEPAKENGLGGERLPTVTIGTLAVKGGWCNHWCLRDAWLAKAAWLRFRAERKAKMTRQNPALLITVMAWACSPPHPLVGEWEMLSGRMGTEQLSEQESAAIKWIFSDDNTGVFIDGIDTTKFRYWLDMEKDPAWLDMTIVDSDAPVQKWEAVIEFNGDTVRMLAIQAGEGERPTAESLSNPFSFALFGDEAGMSAIIRRRP